MVTEQTSRFFLISYIFFFKSVIALKTYTCDRGSSYQNMPPTESSDILNWYSTSSCRISAGTRLWQLWNEQANMKSSQERTIGNLGRYRYFR